MSSLTLHMANQCTKFEVSRYNHSIDILGGIKYKIGHWLGFPFHAVGHITKPCPFGGGVSVSS